MNFDLRRVFYLKKILLFFYVMFVVFMSLFVLFVLSTIYFHKIINTSFNDGEKWIMHIFSFILIIIWILISFLKILILFIIRRINNVNFDEIILLTYLSFVVPFLLIWYFREFRSIFIRLQFNCDCNFYCSCRFDLF